MRQLTTDRTGGMMTIPIFKKLFCKPTLPPTLVEWGKQSGLSPADFHSEIWKTVMVLGGMSIDDHPECSNKVTWTIENEDDKYDYELVVKVTRTQKDV